MDRFRSSAARGAPSRGGRRRDFRRGRRSPWHSGFSGGSRNRRRRPRSAYDWGPGSEDAAGAEVREFRRGGLLHQGIGTDGVKRPSAIHLVSTQGRFLPVRGGGGTDSVIEGVEPRDQIEAMLAAQSLWP